jgi:ribonucleoside-diphosphate reductase alpha chain
MTGLVGPSGVYEELHAKKYRGPDESFREGCNRQASALTDSSHHYDVYRHLLLSEQYLNAGRVQSSVGSVDKITAAHNCFVSGTIADSFVFDPGNIMQRAAEAAATMRLGGGIGYDFSTLRPYGSLIKGVNSQTEGPLVFMGIFDAVCNACKSKGDRRGAQMGVMRIDHPDIERFIHAKQRLGALENFNISVAVTDEFMFCLKHDKPFPLRFNGEVHREVNPRNLWEMLMRSTWDWAEPGVLFIDTINRMNNLYYCEYIAATNPCVTGETVILTSKGYKRIDLLVGTEIKIWNGYNWSSVIPVITGKNKHINKISFSDGSELNCTDNHKFILHDGNRVPCTELKVDDKLQKNNWPIIQGTDKVIHPYSQGFFSGDGWEDKRGRQYIGLYGAKKELVEHFPSKSVHEYKITGGFEGTNITETKIYIYLGKSILLQKSFVPDSSAIIKHRLEWLAGLCDSDGCTTSERTCIQISSKDRQFLYAVKLMLNTLGVTGTLSPMKDCWRISVSPCDVFKLLKLGLSCKRLKLSENKPQRKASRFITVILIEDAGYEETVYCFTENINHSGIFNGVMTSQCGEQPLPPFGACLLGSYNLVRFLKWSGSKYEFDWDMLKGAIKWIVQATDNVIDRTIYPLPEQKIEALAKRRMGCGITGLANCLEALGHPYASDGFIDYEARILELIMNESYLASARLAGEKGTFPMYKKREYLEGEFIQTLPGTVLHEIEKHGMRNSHLTSIAPTGTISFCSNNVSSGIEPPYDYHYERTIMEFGGHQKVWVDDYGFKQLGIKGRTIKGGDITIAEHLRVLGTAQKYVDSAISKTCNLSPSIIWEEFCQVYIDAYEMGAKGCTTYRPGGKREGIFNSKEDKEAACSIDALSGQKECSE